MFGKTMIDTEKRFIQRLEYIPTLPIIFRKIIQTLNDPNSSAKDLKNVIVNDQSISAKVINLANSAYFGFNRRITEITKAIVVIGFKTVKNIVLSISIIDTVKKISDSREFDRTEFWYNSVGTAQTTVNLGNFLNITNKESLFVCGLLHDIGKVMMDYFYPDQYDKVIEKGKESVQDIYKIEEDVFGFDHTEAGFWISQNWEFPEILSYSIRFHHNVKNAPEDYRKIAAIVAISDFISRSAGFGNPPIRKTDDYIDDAIDILSLKYSYVNNLIEDLKANEDKVKIFFRELA